MPKGTSFLVKNLFFNIPARRNFLKSGHVELKHIIDEFERVALAHPTTHFVLISNGAEIFNLPSSNYRQRIVNIFGGKTNEKLVPVNEETEIITISGFVGKPEFAKKNRSEQFFLVNDRFIKSSFLHHAVMSAYEGLLKEGNQPSYFAYFEETDMCHRVWLAGYRIVYAFKSVIYHKMGATSSNLNNSFVQYHSFKNRIATYIKNLNSWHMVAMISVHVGLSELFSLFALLRGNTTLFIAVSSAGWCIS